MTDYLENLEQQEEVFPSVEETPIVEQTGADASWEPEKKENVWHLLSNEKNPIPLFIVMLTNMERPGKNGKPGIHTKKRCGGKPR